MRKLKTELYNATMENWKTGQGKDVVYPRCEIATVSAKRKTFDVETWRAIRRALKILAKRGLRSGAVRVYPTFEASKNAKSKVLVGNEEVFVEVPSEEDADNIYRLLIDKMDSENLDSRCSAAKLSRYKTKRRIDFAWVSFQEQMRYNLNHD